MASLNLNSLLKGPISKCSHIQCVNLGGGHNSVHNILNQICRTQEQKIVMKVSNIFTHYFIKIKINAKKSMLKNQNFK